MCPLTMPPIRKPNIPQSWAEDDSMGDLSAVPHATSQEKSASSTAKEETPAPTREEDEELVTRLLARDKEAFEIFYTRYSPILLRRLYRMTGDRQVAQEFLQEILLEVLESLKNYKATGALGAWLNRITTFVMIDHFRQKRRHAGFWERWSNQLSSLHERPTALPGEVMESDELRDLVRAQLEYLSPRKRMAILLCDIEGLSLEDASEQMNIPPGTVSSRLHHGRRELRQRIKNEVKKRGLAIEDILHE